MHNKMILKSPNNCSSQEKEKIYNFLKGGNQVTLCGLTERIESAKLLGFIFEDNQILGVAALKIPDKSYKEDIFKKAQASDDPNDYKYEIGYASTKPEYQGKGICSQLIQGIIKEVNDEKLFATTRVNNKQMQHILGKNGFEKIGPYISFKGNKCFLFVKPKR